MVQELRDGQELHSEAGEFFSEAGAAGPVAVWHR